MALTTRIEKTFNHELTVEDVEDVLQEIRIETGMSPGELGSARFRSWSKAGFSGVTVSWKSS